MITLYKPKIEDLWFREKLLNDKDTMSYNDACGGTISFPKEKWEEWYNRWVNTDEKKRLYRYILNEKEEFVGEASYHYDDNFKAHMVDVIVYSKFRKRGYGREALLALIENAKQNGIKSLSDNIAINNPAITLFFNLGFKEEYRNDEFIMLKIIIN